MYLLSFAFKGQDSYAGNVVGRYEAVMAVYAALKAAYINQLSYLAVINPLTGEHLYDLQNQG